MHNENIHCCFALLIQTYERMQLLQINFSSLLIIFNTNETTKYVQSINAIKMHQKMMPNVKSEA